MLRWVKYDMRHIFGKLMSLLPSFRSLWWLYGRHGLIFWWSIRLVLFNLLLWLLQLILVIGCEWSILGFHGRWIAPTLLWLLLGFLLIGHKWSILRFSMGLNLHNWLRTLLRFHLVGIEWSILRGRLILPSWLFILRRFLKIARECFILLFFLKLCLSFDVRLGFLFYFLLTGNEWFILRLNGY